MRQSSEAENLKILLGRFLEIYYSISSYLPEQYMAKELAECKKLVGQLAEEEFPIAFVSVHPHGKSTVINALLEQNLLPAGALEARRFATLIKSGAADKARLVNKDGSEAFLPALADLAATIESRSADDEIAYLEISLQNSGFPNRYVLVDLPVISGCDAAQLVQTYQFIKSEAKAVVFCIGPEDVELADPALQCFFDELHAEIPAIFGRSFLLVNQWDQVDEDLQAEAGAVLDASLTERGYGFAAQRIYKVSALNYLILNYEINNSSGIYRNIEALRRYGDLEAIFADPHGLIDQFAELHEFKRFKSDLTGFVQQTAGAELYNMARSALITAIVILSSDLHDQDISLDADKTEKYLHDYRENYVDTILTSFKQDINAVLERFENDIALDPFPVWNETVQTVLVNNIRQFLLDPEQGLARQIIPGLGKGGIAVPQISKFVTEVFEAVQLDQRMVEALENTARSREKLDRLKFELKQPFAHVWFEALEKRVDAVLNPEYIAMRIYGILENLITWRVWHRDIEQKLDNANLENVETIIREINIFLSRNQEKIRERVQKTIKYHFQRYVIPKLKDIFSIQIGDANQLTAGLKAKIRSTVDEPGNTYNDQYQIIVAALQAKQDALAKLTSLKQELYQL